MAIQQKTDIAIVDEAKWLVEPSKLIMEIRSPGFTGLSGILPCADPLMDAWARLDTEQIKSRSDLNNLLLRFLPVARNVGFVSPYLSDERSYGQFCIDSAKEYREGLKYVDFAGRSVLYITTPMRKFYQDVDQAVDDAGISEDEIVLLDKLYSSKNEGFEKMYVEIGKKVHKVLRAKGYSNRDLTA